MVTSLYLACCRQSELATLRFTVVEAAREEMEESKGGEKNSIASNSISMKNKTKNFSYLLT